MPSRRAGILRSQIFLLLGLPLYVGVVWAMQRVLGIGAQPVGWLPALVLVLVPSVLWLVYFYLQDRYEPEPTHYVVFTFLLGALVAAPLAGWLIDGVFTLDRWATLERFSGAHVAAAFLVVGISQELSKYLVVRYTVYLSDEFDEPVDGIVYCTAAGIGFATALNFKFVVSGVLPTVGAIDATITTLSHACFSGAVGYALGQAKFREGGGQGILVLGLLVAVALNGAFYLLQPVIRSGFDLSPWRSLALGAGFAAMVFGGITWLVRRSLAQSATAEATTKGEG